MRRGSRRASFVVMLVALGCAVLPGSASAAFGFTDVDVTFTDAHGAMAPWAGSHPFAFNTSLTVNTTLNGEGFLDPDGEAKNIALEQIAGLVGDPQATPRCPTEDFVDRIEGRPQCADATAVGIAAINAGFHPVPPGAGSPLHVAIYNLEPPPGVVAKLGFVVLNEPVTIEIRVSQKPPYNLVAQLTNIPQVLLFYGSTVTLWGNPADPRHDLVRGSCLEPIKGSNEPISLGTCPAHIPERPFVTLPRSCKGPLSTILEATSWENPSAPATRDVAVTHDESTPPRPLGMVGCDKLGFAPGTTAQPTAKSATSPSGLDFSLDVHDEGLTNPDGLAQSDLDKAVVKLPQGMTINPAQAEGLAVCSEADVARETATSEAGDGCPNASKIGTVEVETPLLEQTIKGSLYVATPYENPEHSLIALYLVLQNKELGISIHLPLRVETDPATGQITTISESVPELPFSHFKLHFREGTRSPLATPPACGTYAASSMLYPSSGGAPVESNSTFQIISGPNGGPCPAGGTPPFKPELLAGAINNAAGAYSPFNVRISRSDSEQEITNFSIKLPPGVTGKLAGVPECTDAQIAAAKARERQPHGGQEELDSPSCPAASEVGRTLVGAGVGPSLTYVPGKVYLAGPYHGAPLSLAAITAAKAGPFDLGTVVIRYALKINPETAEVFVDATGSDPIPHIVNGIPVHLRDIRAYVDRPDFVLNPTSCEPTSTASTVLGSGLDFASSSDDVPVTVTSRFQAADCASLPYKPRLALRLKGGTKRGQNPQLTAILRPRPGDANSKRVSVTLPHSEFLDQSHIKTICTRVQFKAGAGNGSACPPGSVYGTVKAWTPLLDNPLQGNVYLRSSEHPLPDLVLALHGQIDFTAVGRIDSVDGGIRNTFEAVPDAPITKVEVKFAGGKKSLLVNSTNICKGKHRASLEYAAHSGRAYEAKAPLQARCKGKAKKQKRSQSHGPKAKRGKGSRQAWRTDRGW